MQVYKLVYLGIDVNATSCQSAQKRLRSLQNVAVTILDKDIVTLNTVEIEPFDMVIIVHVLYYISSLESALRNAKILTKNNGKII